MHIPKTAGTSFRMALEQQFSSDKGLLDYGKLAVQTSEKILDLAYTQPDLFALKRHIEDSGIRFLSGHVEAKKYVCLFGAESLTTFVRDPIERLYSEFTHAKTRNGFDNSFSKFIERAFRRDLQSKWFGEVPIPAFGQIGLTETYLESLSKINRHFEVSLPELTLNTREDTNRTTSDISTELLDEARALNAADISFYKDVVDWLKIEERYGRHVEPAFVRGEVNFPQNCTIAGWASREGSDEPVVVELRKNGEKVDERSATKLRPRLRSFKMPREGHLGFRFKVPNLDTEDRYEVVVKQTDQPLLNGVIHKGTQTTNVEG